MKTHGIGARRARRGMALMYTIFAVFAAATMVSMMMTMTFSTSRTSKVRLWETQAQYLAEGGLAAANVALNTAIAGWKTPPAAGTTVIDGIQVDFAIAATGFNGLQVDGSGLQTVLTGYELTSTVAVDGSSHTARQLVNAEATPIFQFAVFYDQDLEINPGPSMQIGGRVHTNGNLHLNSGNKLTLDTNYVRAVGQILRTRKDDPSQSAGTVAVRNWVENPFDPSEPQSFFNMNSTSQMAALGVHGGPYDATFTGYDANGDGDYYDTGDWLPWTPGALDYWGQTASYNNGSGHTVMDGSHGVSHSIPPPLESIQMYEPTAGGDYLFNSSSGQYEFAGAGLGTHDKGYYHANADLSVITLANGNLKIYDKQGNDLTSALSSVVSAGTIYDARQAGGGSGKVKVTKIDLEALKFSGHFPANGLLYTAHYGAGTGTQAKGVQLHNGEELGGPLTVVTENSVYVQGDYNKVNKKGASVIGDAVNLLSNAWTNGKTSSNGLPSASDTVFNVAIVTGNQETQGTSYNGGLENLPRFHENWSGKRCEITGSLVNTWGSHFADGAWLYGGNRYTAPNRVWSYDKDFNDLTKLPPFTPMVVSSSVVATW